MSNICPGVLIYNISGHFYIYLIIRRYHYERETSGYYIWNIAHRSVAIKKLSHNFCAI